MAEATSFEGVRLGAALQKRVDSRPQTQKPVHDRCKREHDVCDRCGLREPLWATLPCTDVYYDQR